MSKPSVFENKAFQKSDKNNNQFNLIPKVNSFNSIFEAKPIDDTEFKEVESLLIEEYQSGEFSEETIKDDSRQLKKLSGEIRAIGRQGIVLMGERVHRAREILKPYKNGIFTQWMTSTFGTRKTGYNTLSYFELYRSLPQERLKEQFKKIPLKAAYILASREGNLDTKSEIIRKYHNYDYNHIFDLIQKKLPIKNLNKKKGKTFSSMLIEQMKKAAQKLDSRNESIQEEDRSALKELRILIDLLLKKH